MFRKVVITIELKKSMNKLPTRGTTNRARGLGPKLLFTAWMFAIALGVAPMPKPQVAAAKQEAS